MSASLGGTNDSFSLHAKLRTDGYDCGDEVATLLSQFLEEGDVRMVMFEDPLFTERVCRTEPQWWMNNKVPSRVDHVAYQDLAPYMIQTEGSLTDLNSRLDKDVPFSLDQQNRLRWLN